MNEGGMKTSLETPQGVCALHPNRSATTVCSRCGDYACADCYEISSNGTEMCNRCRAILPAPASLRSRFWGNAIDAGSFGVAIGTGVALGDLVSSEVGGWALGIATVAALCIAQLHLVAKSGQSLGKLALGTRTIRADGTRAEVWRVLLLRNALPLGLAIALPGIFRIVDVAFIFGTDRRCVHDYMADTVVVEARRPQA